MIFLEEALEKFEQLDPEVIFTVNSERFTKPLSALSEKYGVSFDAAMIFIIVGELEVADLPAYLIREFDLPEDKAQAAAADLTGQVIEPMAERLLFLSADPDKPGITDNQEKEILRKIFSEALLSELDEVFMIKNALNYRLFNIFEKDFNFKRELERLLYENPERLTSSSIMVESKTVPPTIANWLADFISRKGTGDFNTVALSDYLTNSENGKNLSVVERQRVSDLLTVYRNLKFFPTNQTGKPIDQWQIIPFDQAEFKHFMERQEQGAGGEELVVAEAMADTGRPAAKTSGTASLDDKLAPYNWSKITGIERRALLEDLGVPLKDFVKWSEKKK